MTKAERHAEVQQMRQAIKAMRQAMTSQLDFMEARLENLVEEDAEGYRPPVTDWSKWEPNC